MFAVWEERFATPSQCVKGTWWVVSTLTLGFCILALLYYFDQPNRLDPEYNNKCGDEGSNRRVCDMFHILALLGTSCFLLFWIPTTAGAFLAYYWPVITNADMSPLAAGYRSAGARANVGLAAIALVLLGIASFGFGVTLITRMHSEWAFWAYAYIALIVGGTSGLIIGLATSFYLGSVLVLQVMILSGAQTEEEIRRRYMFGAGSNLARPDELESDSGHPELPRDATEAELRHERRRLRDARHKLNAFSRELHHREALLEKRESELTRVERKLARRKHDLEEGEKALSGHSHMAVVT